MKFLVMMQFAGIQNLNKMWGVNLTAIKLYILNNVDKINFIHIIIMYLFYNCNLGPVPVVGVIICVPAAGAIGLLGETDGGSV